MGLTLARLTREFVFSFREVEGEGVCVCVSMCCVVWFDFFVYWLNFVTVAVFRYDVCVWAVWECATLGCYFCALLSLLWCCFYAC